MVCYAWIHVGMCDMCMYICMCVCMYVCMYVCMQVHMCVLGNVARWARMKQADAQNLGIHARGST